MRQHITHSTRPFTALIYPKCSIESSCTRAHLCNITSHRIVDIGLMVLWPCTPAPSMRCIILSLSLFCAIFQIAPCVAVCALIESKYPKPLYGYGRPKMHQHTMGASFAIRRVLYGNGEKEKRSTHNLFGSCSAASRDIDIKWGFGRNSDEPAKEIKKKLKRIPFDGILYSLLCIRCSKSFCACGIALRPQLHIRAIDRA